MPFVVLIPAAGRSRRMGAAKAWLQLAGECLLQRIVTTACSAGASAVVVVAGAEESPGQGPEAADLVTRIDVATRLQIPAGKRLSVAVADPDGALIDSIRAGLGLVPEGADLLLWPVDAPFADTALVRAMADALGAHRERIVVPVVGERRGHPILLGAEAALELDGPHADAGANAVVRRLPERVTLLPAADRRVVAPLNTPEEATALGVAPGG